MKTLAVYRILGIKIMALGLVAFWSLPHFAFAQPSRQVAAWGLNGNGQSWVPQDLENVKSVVTGFDFSLALLEDGTVRAWGGAAAWQTNLPPGLTNISAIAACSTHCLALRSNGTVVGWGDTYWLTSVITSASTRSAVTNPPVTGVKAIAVGAYHSVLVLSNGTVWPYGVWLSSLASVGSAPDLTGSGATAVASYDNHYIVLKNDGTVRVRADISASFTLQVPSGLSGVKAVAAGSDYCVALKSNGTAVAWGANIPDLFADSGLTNITAIAAGISHYLALLDDGTIASVGSSAYGENIIPQGLTNIAAISAGSYSSVAIVTNDSLVISKQPKGATVYAGHDLRLGCTATGLRPMSFQWQRDSEDIEGATNSTLLLANISNALVGNYRVVITNQIGSVTSSVAKVTLGPIMIWGADFGEQTEVPAGVTNPVALDGSINLNSPWAVRNSNGTVTIWGGKFGTMPDNLTNVIYVDVGPFRTCAVRSDGRLETWGSDSIFPITVPSDLTNVVVAAVGGSHLLALTADGNVVGFGSSLATNVPGDLGEVSAIAAGYSSSFAVMANGTIRAWGMNLLSLINVPSGLTNIAAISIGQNSALALRTDGTVTNWGFVPSLPSGVSNVVAVSCGNRHALALLSDGTIVSWGSGSSTANPATNIPTGLSNVVSIAAGADVSGVIVGDGKPAFPTRISRRTAHAGDTLQIPAFATSSLPVSYQWYFNGQPLEGQTNSLLQLQTVPVTAAGEYQVVASNAAGTVTSAVTTVMISRDSLRFDTAPDGLNATNKSLNLKLLGAAGAGEIVIYSSTNLLDWEPVYTNPPFVGPLEITDLAFTNNASRFYRAVEGP